MRFPVRIGFAVALVLGQLFALMPDASAASSSITAKWDPTIVGSSALSGKCPTSTNADAACQVNRGATYKTSATFSLDKDSDSVLIDVDGGGLDVQAVSHATGSDYTNALKAGQTETIDLTITIPEISGHRDRNFYIGHVILSAAGGRVNGSLTISVNIPPPRVAWTKQTDNRTGDRPPISQTLGSGQVITRTLDFVSNVDVNDFGVNTNTDRVAITGVPNTLSAGQTESITMTYSAPTVNRKTITDVVLRPAVGGVQALERALRVRLIILPAEVSWSPPQVRDTLIIQRQTPIERTVFMTSNYDVSGVRFQTADLGLTPILSPLNAVDMKAGVPQPVVIRMCPGYAPTTYFLGITAYQGSKPLNKRLQIRMKVADNGQGLPKPNGSDPCAAP